jgi:hypothetical protein
MGWTFALARLLRLMASGVELGFSVTTDEMGAFMKAFKDMQAKEVLAGFPEDETPREDEDGNPSPITNAALGYIHNTGMPEQNIPARPFMVEGIETKREPISDGMEVAGLAALDGDVQGIDKALMAVALIAQDGIKNKILDGPFEPLAESTLRARAARGREGAQKELDSRAAGNAPNAENARPLNDTAQMRNAVQGVVREK